MDRFSREVIERMFADWKDTGRREALREHGRTTARYYADLLGGAEAVLRMIGEDKLADQARDYAIEIFMKEGEL